MARLPDGSAFGALPSALSNRPIATYDASGYARGAAALAEGVSDLGKGISRAAGGFEDMRGRSARTNLDQAKANASYVVKTNELRKALAQESDPDTVATAYPEQFRAAFDEASSLIDDPQTREVWGLARGADRDGQIAASLDQVEALRRRQEVQSVTSQLDTLRTLALDNDDDATRDSLIGAGHKLISGLEDTKLLDEDGGRAMREDWTRAYATERLGRLPPEERIRFLEQGQGTIAEFIPDDDRQKLVRVAQADAADATRKAQSDTALAQYSTRSAIDDDLKRVAATGRGRDDLSPQQIDDALGPEVRRAWQAQRDDARAIWTLTRDLSTLTEREIQERVASSAENVAEVLLSGFGGRKMNNSETATTAQVQVPNDPLQPEVRDQICKVDPVAEGARFGNEMMKLAGKKDLVTGEMRSKEWAIEQGYQMERGIRQIQSALCGPPGAPT